MTRHRIELWFDDELLEAILRLLSALNGLQPQAVQAEDPALNELGRLIPSTSKDRGACEAKSAIRNPQSEIEDLLADFGIEEPALSELSSNGLSPELVRAWILYVQTQDLERPAGYLVNRLRAGQTPADVWMTLGRLDEAQQARLRELAGHRRWIGEWDVDQLRELGLDAETAEAWYQAHKPPP